jgi:predicted esterase
VAIEDAEVVTVMVHGRAGVPATVGPSALPSDAGPEATMRELERRLRVPQAAYVLPLADQGSWYPKRFTDPRDANEPRLTHALQAYEAVVTRLTDAGWRPDRLALVGFSQGACLTLEYVARWPRRYRAVAALTGGLIGPDEALTRPSAGLERTPLLITTKEDDQWVPAERTRTSAELLAEAGAEVDLRILPGAQHSITEEEIDAVRELIRTET